MVQCSDQLGRIRGDRQSAAVVTRLAQTQPGVGRQHAIRIDDQRVQVQFGNLGEIDNELADPYQRLGDGGLVGRRVVAKPPQRRRGTRARDQAMRQREIDRGKIGGDIAGNIGCRAALAEADDRPERLIVGHPDPKLAPADRLALHQQRDRARVMSHGKPPGGGNDFPCVVQIERQPTGGARIGAHALAQLHHSGEAQQCCCLCGIFRRGGGPVRHHRDAVGAQHRQRLVLHRGEAPGAANTGEYIAHRVAIRGNGQHRAGRQFPRRGAVAAVMHEVQEAAHRLPRRGEHGHAGFGEVTPADGAGGLAHGTDQKGHLHCVARLGECGDRGLIDLAAWRMNHKDAAYAGCPGSRGCQRRQARRLSRLHVHDVCCEL